MRGRRKTVGDVGGRSQEMTGEKSDRKGNCNSRGQRMNQKVENL